MNLLNYGSPEACKRLHDAGIVVETEARWMFVVGLGWKVFSSDDPRHKTNPVFIPALSMAEAWRMLKPYVHGHYEDMRDRVWQALLFDNPTDALIDLKIWVEKGKALDSMINNEAHKAAAGWHGRARRIK
jgi:hypothetical protein